MEFCNIPFLTPSEIAHFHLPPSYLGVERMRQTAWRHVASPLVDDQLTINVFFCPPLLPCTCFSSHPRFFLFFGYLGQDNFYFSFHPSSHQAYCVVLLFPLKGISCLFVRCRFCVTAGATGLLANSGGISHKIQQSSHQTVTKIQLQRYSSRIVSERYWLLPKEQAPVVVG